MLCVFLSKVLHIYYIVYYLCVRNKANTNSTDPRRSLKSATKTMRIMSIYKKEEWTAKQIRENITNLFGNDEIGSDYAETIIGLLAQTDSTECVIEGEGMDMQPMIVKRADIYENNGEAEIAEEDLHF